MLRGLFHHAEKKTFYSPVYWKALSNLLFSQDKKEAQKLLQRVVDSHRKQFSEIDWRPWLAENEFASLPAAYTRLFYHAYFRHPLPDDLKPSISSQPIPVFSLDGSFLRLSRPWMAACQQELGLNLVLPELLTVRKLPSTNQDYADYVHAVHRTTYNLIKLASLKFTMESVYRGAVSHTEELTIRGQLAPYPIFDVLEEVYDNERHIRCCSIKPHACENYDITPVRSHYFVLGRAMEEIGTSEACVLPTVLFSTNSKVPNRYKGNTEQTQLLIMGEDRMKVFFRLFEMPIG